MLPTRHDILSLFYTPKKPTKTLFQSILTSIFSSRDVDFD